MKARPVHVITLNVILICLLADALAQTSTNAGSKPPPISGIEKIGGRVSAPRLVYSPDPEYSAEALDMKYEGFCVLSVVVGSDGRPRDIKIVQELGHGLDEKAVEAVKEWKFEPAMKDGKPVAVQTYVQVQFHRHELSDSNPQEQLTKPATQSNKGTPYTQEQLAELRAKCAPYINTMVEDLESKRISLPHECVEFLAWMRWMRKEHLANEQKLAGLFDGTWEGDLVFHEPKYTSRYRITIQGSAVRVYVQHPQGMIEAKPVAFHIERVMTNAIIYATDSGQDNEGTWVETWVFAMTQENGTTLLTNLTRLVNNIDLPVSNDHGKFAEEAAGKLDLIPASSPDIQ